MVRSAREEQVGFISNSPFDRSIIENFPLDVNQKKEPSVKQGHVYEFIVNRLKG